MTEANCSRRRCGYELQQQESYNRSHGSELQRQDAWVRKSVQAREDRCKSLVAFAVDVQ